MMDTEEAADNSLAFVDVITNGLGSMLVLFFLAALLQTQLEFPATPPPSAEASDSDYRPFVIIAQVDPPIFDLKSCPLQFSVATGQPTSSDRGDHFDWGTDFAIVALDSPPRTGASVIAVGGEKDATVTYSIHHGDRKTYQHEVKLVAGGRVELWPPKEKD